MQQFGDNKDGQAGEHPSITTTEPDEDVLLGLYPGYRPGEDPLGGGAEAHPALREISRGYGDIPRC